MMVVLEGPWPAWIQQCSDQVLKSRLGSGAHTRGAAYARQRAVLTMTLVGDGQVLSASVRGSGRRSYQTVVKAQASRSGGQVDFSGHCTCPMQLDCKHVAAVIITARGMAGQAQPAARPAATWEIQLAGLLRAADPTSAPAVGLQLEVVTSGAPNSGAHARVRLRAVTPGKNGKWVRTGMGWRDLEYGYGSVRALPEQRHVLRGLLATFRARQPPYSSGYSDPQVFLDDLGPGVWRYLAEAKQAGISLVSVSTPQQVQLSPDPAAVVMDLRQTGPEQAAELSLLLRLPDEDLRPDSLVLVGSPAHGAFVATPDLLRLLPLDRPIDPGMQPLLTGGPLQIPAPEVDPRQPGLYDRLVRPARRRVRRGAGGAVAPAARSARAGA